MGGGSSNKSPGGVRYCSQYQGVCSGGAQVWSPKGALSPPPPPPSSSVVFGGGLHEMCATAIYSAKGSPFIVNPKEGLVKGRSPDITWTPVKYGLDAACCTTEVPNLVILGGNQMRV